MAAGGIGSRIAPARFLGFLAVFAGTYAALRWGLGWSDWREIVAMAFDAAALAFLASLIPLMRDRSAETMRRDARRNDANRAFILGLTTLLTLVVMAAITGELKGAQSGDWLAMAKLVGTLLLTWTFANAVYTLHYAHSFYSPKPDTGGDCEGIDFPGTETPDYGDFAYFAFTLGMTFQTSDVEITAPAVRRIALLHSFAAFIFNIGVIAFTINVLGGSS